MWCNKINLRWKVAAGCTVAFPVQYWQWESSSQLCNFKFVFIKSSLWRCSAYEHFPLELNIILCFIINNSHDEQAQWIYHIILCDIFILYHAFVVQKI